MEYILYLQKQIIKEAFKDENVYERKLEKIFNAIHECSGKSIGKIKKEFFESKYDYKITTLHDLKPAMCYQNKFNNICPNCIDLTKSNGKKCFKSGPTLTLKAIPTDKKILTIKNVQKYTGFDLMSSKRIIDCIPSLITFKTEQNRNDCFKELKLSGCEVR